MSEKWDYEMLMILLSGSMPNYTVLPSYRKILTFSNEAYYMATRPSSSGYASAIVQLKRLKIC